MQQDRIATEIRPSCYLCGNDGEVLYQNLVDHLFGAPGEWNFKKCSNLDCGFIWLDPMPTVGEIGKAYKNYYTHDQSKNTRWTLLAKIFRGLFHKPSIALLRMHAERKRYKCMYLDQVPAGRLLEVGCGSGKRLARMKALGWNVMGQEIDPAAAHYVQKKWSIDVHLGSLETMSLPEEKYDVIIMSHVIEHVHDPVGLLSTCRNLLKNNGLLAMLTPNAESYGHHKFGKAWRGLEPPRHLHLFTCETLVQVSQEAGFSHQHCWTTSVSAYGIGQGSQLSSQRVCGEERLITLRDVLRGLSFQFSAGWKFRKDKSSGEECVLMATK
ncbi:MAG: class I SAM-dependent methyltransferase [Betaproteobacteria bacterium]|nr:class I SAM-dependent methyltransferase [Betaproteobacteria bacterium]